MACIRVGVGAAVADRSEPEASCSAWHADGMAGEDDHAWHLAAKAQARAMGEADHDDTSLVGKSRHTADANDQYVARTTALRSGGLLGLLSECRAVGGQAVAGRLLF